MLLNNMREWLSNIVDSNVSISAGQYIDNPQNKDKFILVIKQTGGSVRPPFVRYPRFTLTLFGRYGQRSDVLQLGGIIDKIMNEAEKGNPPECIGGMRVASMPTGANYTQEDRAFYVFDIELIF